MMRQPIVATLGHVDHGKTSLLDAIRKTKVQGREAGAITQAIGASEVPVSVINAACARQLAAMRISLNIPGLLFIDTPGHEVFGNLRKRGGSIADIAILVVDCAKGVEAQTEEAIEILRGYKTPFIVAFNKIDAISGWRPVKGAPFADSISQQRPDVAADLDAKLYNFVAQLYAKGFSSERFDRVGDFTKQVVIVPVSARTSEGVSDLLMLVAGLAQKFLEKRLSAPDDGVARCSMLEIREEHGVGMTIDAILYGGSMRPGDFVAFPAVEGGVILSKVKAILRPGLKGDTRDPTQKYASVPEAAAASGIKVVCDGAGHALAGGTMFSDPDEAKLREASLLIPSEVGEIVFESTDDGVIIKADALGSLEAITKLFKAAGIPVRAAGIGAPTKGEVLQSASVAAKDPFLGVIFAFNIPLDPQVKFLAANNSVTVFEERIIYNLVADYRKWHDEKQERSRKEAFCSLAMPSRMVILKDCCFRASKPCIVGVEITAGTLKSGVELMNLHGEAVGVLKGIQADKETVPEAGRGMQVAVSIDGPVFGRSLNYGDELLVSIPKDCLDLLAGKYASALSPEERNLVDLLRAMKRRA